MHIRPSDGLSDCKMEKKKKRNKRFLRTYRFSVAHLVPIRYRTGTVNISQRFLQLVAEVTEFHWDVTRHFPE